MLASPFEPQASFEPTRDCWRDSWDLGSQYRELVEPQECKQTFSDFTKRLPTAQVKPLRVTKATKHTPKFIPVSAWSDSDDSESDYEANSICDSDTDVEGCQCLPKYAGLPVPDSPKSQSSDFTVQDLKKTTKKVSRGIRPMLSPSETVMERYAPLEWSDKARDALKNALDRRQQAMDDAGVSHFIQIEALHNCLKDVAFGVSLREL